MSVCVIQGSSIQTVSDLSFANVHWVENVVRIRHLFLRIDESVLEYVFKR